MSDLMEDQVWPSEGRPMGDLRGLGPMWIGPSLAHHPLDPNTAGVLEVLAGLDSLF